MDKEPALIIGGASSVIFAVAGALVAFGVNFSDAQRDAVIGVVVSTVAFIWLVTGLIRQSVISPKTAQKLVDTAKEAGETNSPAPVVEP